jgi:hypothetical protein
MPKPRLQPLTHWPKPTVLLQIYPTTPRRPPSHLRPRRPINLHCRGHLLLYPTLLPHCTNTLLPLPQQAHPTQQCPPLPTTTNTFTLYHPPTPTNTLDIGTSIFYADSENGSHNLWHLGIPFILQNTDHPHLTSETHGTDTSPHNSSNHQHSIHFPSIPPPSGGYSSTSTC